MSTIDSPGSVPRKKARLRTRVHLLKLLCLVQDQVGLALMIAETSTRATMGNALPMIAYSLEDLARAARVARLYENSRTRTPEEIIETLGPP